MLCLSSLIMDVFWMIHAHPNSETRMLLMTFSSKTNVQSLLWMRSSDLGVGVLL